MTIQCKYCAQQLLEDETSCWQCGQPVNDTTPKPQSKASDSWQKQREKADDFEVSTLAVYSSLTLLVILGALLLTLFLGNQPRLQAANLQLPADWLRVSNRQRTFTFYLPPDWTLLDAGSRQEVAKLAAVWQSQSVFPAAIRPLGTLIESDRANNGLVFLASSQPPDNERVPQAFLLVLRSAQLNSLSPERLAETARESEVTLEQAEVVEDQDKQYVALDLEMTDVQLLCQQQWIPGRDEALLVVGCTRVDNPMSITLEQILESFRRLDN